MGVVFLRRRSAAVLVGIAAGLICAGPPRVGPHSYSHTPSVHAATAGDAPASRMAADHSTSLATAAADGPSDAAELEAFLDGLLAKELADQHIAGAAVVVVKDGRPMVAKGYGYADVEHGVAVDPDETLFRTGSLGKLFTWTAVMQLVEQGKLDLDTDINTYLDFRIPDTYPEPITLRNLITHTSGFEDRLLGTVTDDPRRLRPPRQFLIENMSARVYPPGVWPGYANYNAMLAGYIVARASGQPYGQYIQEHIFDPLGMAHSTAESPPPDALRALASVGYVYGDGGFEAFPDYLGQPGGIPSGGLQASAADMGRFMIAHLEGGRVASEDGSERRILGADTARRMQQTLFTPDPRLLGMAYGFSDWSENGQHVLGHQGYAPPMNSVLFLVPDDHLGVFATYNTKDVGDLTTQHTGLEKAFLDHYYTAPPLAPIGPPGDFAQRAASFTGPYRVVSSPATTAIKVIELFGGYLLQLSAPGDGTLVLSAYGTETRFAEAGPLYFRQVDGPFGMVFWEDGNGRITHLYTDLIPEYAAVKMKWYEAPTFNMALAGACALAFLSMLVVVAVGAVRRRRGDSSRARRGERVARWVIVLICVLNLMFLAGFMLWGQPRSELHSLSQITKIVLGLGVLSAVLTVGAVIAAGVAWWKCYWGVAGRVCYTLVTIAAVAFVWFLNSWNVLGWRY